MAMRPQRPLPREQVSVGWWWWWVRWAQPSASKGSQAVGVLAQWSNAPSAQNILLQVARAGVITTWPAASGRRYNRAAVALRGGRAQWGQRRARRFQRQPPLQRRLAARPGRSCRGRWGTGLWIASRAVSNGVSARHKTAAAASMQPAPSAATAQGTPNPWRQLQQEGAGYTARSNAAAVVVGRHLCLFGGWDESGVLLCVRVCVRLAGGTLRCRRLSGAQLRPAGCVARVRHTHEGGPL